MVCRPAVSTRLILAVNAPVIMGVTPRATTLPFITTFTDFFISVSVRLGGSPPPGGHKFPSGRKTPPLNNAKLRALRPTRNIPGV